MIISLSPPANNKNSVWACLVGGPTWPRVSLEEMIQHPARRCYGRFFLGIWKIPQGENEHKFLFGLCGRGVYDVRTHTVGGLKYGQVGLKSGPILSSNCTSNVE